MQNLLSFSPGSMPIVRFTRSEITNEDVRQFQGESDRLKNMDIELPLVFDLKGVISISAQILQEMAILHSVILQNVRARDGDVSVDQKVVLLCDTPALVALKIKLLGLLEVLRIYEGTTISALME